jgi:hypothetical protein
VVRRTGLWIPGRRAYDYLIYDGRNVSVLDIPGIEVTSLTASVLQTFAAGGWRLGWQAGRPPSTSWPSRPDTANAANAAVRMGSNRADGAHRTAGPDARRYAYRRQVLGGSQRADSSPGASRGLRTPSSSTPPTCPRAQMAAFLLDRGVAVRSGTESGGGGATFASLRHSRGEHQRRAPRLAAAAAEGGRTRSAPKAVWKVPDRIGPDGIVWI